MVKRKEKKGKTENIINIYGTKIYANCLPEQLLIVDVCSGVI